MATRFSWPVVGHDFILDYLKDSIINGRLVHAYIFSGPTQVGKTLTAKLFAASILCASEDRPCQKCFSCQSLAKNLHPDFYLLEKPEDKKQISIEQVRELITKLSRGAVTGGKKVALISGAENLTTEACNALLKTLEEPTASTILILTANQENVLPTIKSRCQVIKFSTCKSEDLTKYLKSQFPDNKNIDEIVSWSVGKLGLAHQLAGDENIYTEFKDLLTEEIAAAQGGLAERFKKSEKDSAEPDKLRSIISIWQLILRQAIFEKANSTENKNPLAKKDWREITNFASALLNANRQLNGNVNAKLLLDNLYLSL